LLLAQLTGGNLMWFNQSQVVPTSLLLGSFGLVFLGSSITMTVDQNRSKEPSKSQTELSLLVTAVKEGDDSERKSAATRLGSLKDANALDALIDALDDTDQGVVSAAAWALGEIGDTAAVDPLRKAKAKYEQLFSTANAAAYNDSCIPPIYVALRKLKTAEVLVRLLKEGGSGERMDAARDLGERKARLAVDPLIGTLDDNVDCVRSWAAWALGEIGDERAIEPLVRAITKYHEISKTDHTGWNSKCLTSIYVSLEKLTGESFGLNAGKWATWLEARFRQ
jgi:hypothetical protein